MSLFAVCAVLTSGLPVTAPAAAAAGPGRPETFTRPDRASAVAAARSLGKPVEVLDDTTERRRRWANPDGTFTDDLAVAPVRTRRGERWVEIDTTLALRDGAVRPRAAAADVAMSPGGAGALASLAHGQTEVTLGWRGAPLPAPALDGDTARYADALPGVDVEVAALPGGYEQSYVLKDRAAAKTRLELPLRAPGLTARPDGGDLALVDATGQPRAWIGSAIMWDARGRTAAVGLDVRRTADGDVLAMAPDAGFLSDPGTSYPVTVDPVVTIYRYRDSYINSGAPTTNYGSNAYLKIGTRSGSTYVSYLTFNVGGYAGKKIVSAVPKLGVTDSVSCSSTYKTRLFKVTSEWYQGSVTWDDRPTADLTSTGLLAESGTAGGGPAGSACVDNAWAEFADPRLDAAFQSWADGAANYGMSIRTSDNTYGAKDFASGENTSWTPRVSLTWDYWPPDAPTNLTATPGDGSTKLTWDAADGNGTDLTGNVVTVKTTDGAVVATHALSATATAYDVTGLTNGTGYTFSVHASSSGGTGAAATTGTVTPYGVPFAPTDVAATRGDQSVHVTWTAADANGESVDQYQVRLYRSSDDVLVATETTTSTSRPVPATNGTGYYAKVTALNAAGAGAESAASNAVVPAGVPLAPGAVSAASKYESAQVSWTAADGNGDAVTSYTVTSSPGGKTATVTGTTALVTGLTNGTSYTFTVRASNSVGLGAASAPSAAIVAGADEEPSAPTVTSVSALTPETARVEWTPGDNTGRSPILGYRVTASPGGATVTTTGTATYVDVPGLEPADPYTFTVEARNSAGYGAASAPSAPFTMPVDAPDAVTNIAVTPGPLSLTLTWDPPADDNGAPVTSYTVIGFESTGATIPNDTKVVTQPTVTYTSLAYDKSYKFIVFAENSAGNRGSETTVPVQPDDAPPPPPTDVVASNPGERAATVSWTKVTNTGSPVDGFTVTASPGGQTATAGATATSTTVEGLTPGTGYTFTVQAHNAAGYTPASTPSNAVTTQSTAPDAPTGVSAYAPRHQAATVSWSAPAANGSPITSYTIYASGGSDIVVTTVPAGATHADVTGLKNGLGYSFKVKATNAIGTGLYSAPSWPAVTPFDLPPQAPTNIAATAGDRSATVTWSPPDNYGRSAIVDYLVVASPSGRSAVATGSAATTATVTGLPAGQTYTFVVTARNNSGRGDTSVASPGVSVTGGPGAPTGATATAVSSTTANVSWTAPPPDPSITGFRVTAAPGGKCAYTTGGTNVDVPGLVDGRAYQFTVVALTSGSTTGTTCLASHANVFDGPRSAPSAPLTLPVVTTPYATNILLRSLDGAVSVEWLNNGGRADQWTVTANPGGITRTVGGAAVHAVIGGLTNGTSYTVTVTGVNAAGSTISLTATTAPAQQMLSTMERLLPTAVLANGPDVSDDGRYVGWGEGFNSVSGRYAFDALLSDRTEKVTYLVGGRGNSADQRSGPDLSADGRYVAYSVAESQTTDDPNAVRDVYVLDRQTDTVRLASTDAAGNPGNGDSSVLELSPDGRYVLFLSTASDLVPVDLNGSTQDLFVKDLTTGAIELVSTTGAGAPMWDVEARGGLSADGRYVLGENAKSGFWRDRTTGRVVTIADSGWNGRMQSLSRDGLTVTYLAPRGTGTGYDIYQMYFEAASDNTSTAAVVTGIELYNDTTLAASPDASLVAVPTDWDLNIYDLRRARVDRLVDGALGHAYPKSAVIAANNRTVVFPYEDETDDTDMRAVEYVPDAKTTGQVWFAGWRQRVNTGSGDFVESTADARVRAVGPPLENVRTYNSSRYGEAGWFGRGFGSTYETSLRSYDLDVVVARSDGRSERFTRNGDDAAPFQAPRSSSSRLVKNSDGTYTLTHGDSSTMTFSAFGRLTAQTDQHGFQQTLTYGSDGKLDTVTDVTSGRSLHYTWTGARVTAVSTGVVGIHGGPLTWTYSYTGDELTAVCPPPEPDGDTRCVTFQYLGGRLINRFDAYGARTLHLSYHADGRVHHSAADGGVATVFTYPFPGVTEISGPRPGQTARHEYDTSGRLVKEVDAAGKTKTVTYDANGWPHKVTDENNTVTTSVYTAAGDKTSEAVGANATLGTTAKTAYLGYDANHNVTTMRDRRSSSATDSTYLTTRTYDARNNVTAETAPSVDGVAPQRSWTYTGGTEAAIGGGAMPAGLLRTSTDVRGKVTTYSYAANGDLREVENPAGLVARHTYDELGRITTTIVVSAAYPAGNQTTYTYDELSRVVIETQPLTADAVTGEPHQLRVSTTYDRAGRIVRVEQSDAAGDDLSRVTDYGVDRVGRITSMTDNQTGQAEHYEYDDSGNLTARVDRLGRRTEVAYTPRDQRQTVTRKAVDLLDGTGPHDIAVAAYDYDDAGRLTKTTDVLGRATEYTHDTLHRVTKETLLGFDDPAGARDLTVQRVRYDDVGNVLETWRGSDLLRELFTVDALNRVRTHVLDPGGPAEATTTSTYDAAGHELTRAASGNGLVTTAYDDLGLPAQEVVENGATDLTTWYGHDDRGLLASVTDGRGSAAGDAAHTTTMTYDQAGRRTVTALPPVETYTVAGGTETVRPTTTVGYNTFGEAEHVRDPRGAVTTTTFDRLGRQVRVDHPSYTPPSGGPALAPYESWTYDGANRLTQHRNRGGGLTDYRYDGLDHLVGRDDPWVGAVRPTWSFTVDRAGRVLSATDPVGAVAEQTYDKLDRVRTRTEVLRQGAGPALRATTTYSYDDLGHLTKRVDPAAPVAATWLFEHDVTGNLRKVTDPLLEETVTAYDAAGRWVSTTDPLGRKAEAVYDLAGRRTDSKAYAPDSTLVSHVSTSYDAVGNPAVTTSARGYKTWLTYDAANTLRTVQQWLTAVSVTGTYRTTGYDYDAGGLLTRSTDGRGFSTNPTAIGKITSTYDVTYTHNVWGLQESLIEPATTAHPAAADRTWTTSYDDRGLPVSEVRPGGVTVSRTFDALNRLTAEDGASAPGVPAASRTFGYDLAGNLVSAGHPGGTLTFDYDDRGDLVAATHPHSATAVTRDLVGRPVSITDAAGAHAFTWTARGELDTETEPLTGVVIDRDYDDAGQLTLAKFGTNAGVRRYTYDDLGRLKTDKVEDASGVVQTGTTYGYDADGNVTSQDVYAPGNSGTGLNTYQYDAIGRLTLWTNPAGASADYAWDGADNRVEAGAATYVYDQRSRVVSSGSATYTWSPRGTLVSRNLGTGAQAYTFDALDRMVAGGTDTFTYDSLDRIASPGFGYTGLSQEPTVAGTTLSRSVDGSVVAMSQGTPSLVALNQHGDVAARFDASGTVTASRAYEPFGGVTGLVGSTGGFEFQADFQSGAAGLTWMGARWYDPVSGGFASRDTMARHQGAATLLNRYGYGDANPVTFSDPDGHCAMRSTGWGGCSPDAGPNSYAVSYAVAGYTDSAVLAETERMHQLSLKQPPSPISTEGIEDPDVIGFMLMHDVAGVMLGTASAYLGGLVDTFVNTVGRFQTVIGHLDEPAQLYKDLANINAAAFNGTMRAVEEGLAFGSWLIHGATFGAVPKWDPSGALPRMTYAYDDARSREFSSLAEDVFTVVTPGGAALKGLSRLLKVTRVSKAATNTSAVLRRLPRRFTVPAKPNVDDVETVAGVLVDGAGWGTRKIHYRPDAADPQWGLTIKHLNKHMFGSGQHSLRVIDPGGNTERWFGMIQDLAARPVTSTTPNGMLDIIGTFDKANGDGTFRFGIRISGRSDDTFDLVTLLTKQPK